MAFWLNLLNSSLGGLGLDPRRTLEVMLGVIVIVGMLGALCTFSVRPLKDLDRSG